MEIKTGRDSYTQIGEKSKMTIDQSKTKPEEFLRGVLIAVVAGVILAILGFGWNYFVR